MFFIAHFLSVLDIFLRKYERNHITEHAHYYKFKYNLELIKHHQICLDATEESRL